MFRFVISSENCLIQEIQIIGECLTVIVNEENCNKLEYRKKRSKTNFSSNNFWSYSNTDSVIGATSSSRDLTARPRSDVILGIPQTSRGMTIEKVRLAFHTCLTEACPVSFIVDDDKRHLLLPEHDKEIQHYHLWIPNKNKIINNRQLSDFLNKILMYQFEQHENNCGLLSFEGKYNYLTAEEVVEIKKGYKAHLKAQPNQDNQSITPFPEERTRACQLL